MQASSVRRGDDADEGMVGMLIAPFVLYGEASPLGGSWYLSVSSEVMPPPGIYAGTIGGGPGGPTPVLLRVEQDGADGMMAIIEVRTLAAPLVLVRARDRHVPRLGARPSR